MLCGEHGHCKARAESLQRERGQRALVAQGRTGGLRALSTTTRPVAAALGVTMILLVEQARADVVARGVLAGMVAGVMASLLPRLR